MAGCNVCYPVNSCIAAAAGLIDDCCGDTLFYSNSCSAKRGKVSACNPSDCLELEPVDLGYECACDPCERGSGAFVWGGLK